ncbi:hypothetical protein [Thalassolituus hydrocarboniclasticus]|uniref:Uncharacterized protein n=1 Tax=Thalassolituus hydrocarboniclasticus TaxID=2742796 RepID=A0ABY6AD18_9GAMM|nr:hypothetical protein [Thalassolituus hydrocarboniclasticus]UXD88620.1 hypothetical protein HUF19_14790 [Thalassolituus hydrocarboniclasticus]
MTESTLKIIPLVLSWPVAAVLIVLFLRKPIMKVVDRFIDGQSGRAKIGPIEVELGQLADNGKKAIQQLNDINHIIAKSRLIELEITTETLSHAFSTKHKKDLEKVTLELKEKLTELNKK